MAVQEYRNLIQELLLEKAKRSTQSLVEKQIIFDTHRDHYQLVHLGWKRNGNRNYGCVLHLDIKAKFGYSTMVQKKVLLML